MASITIVEHFNATPEQAFAVLSNMPDAPNVIEGISRVEMLTPGPIGEGTRFKETRVMYGREATEEMEITEYRAPTRLVVEAENYGAHYRTIYSVEPEAAGAKVTMEFSAEPVSLFAKIFNALFARRMMAGLTSVMAKDLADAKRAAEAT